MLMGSLDILISPFVESFLARKPGGSGGGIRGVCLTLGVRVLYCKNTKWR